MKKLIAVVLAAAALAAVGCGGAESASDQPTSAMTAAAQPATTSSVDEEWVRQAVEEVLHEYRVDIARHCVAVIGFETGETAQPPTDESFTLFGEAIDGTISIARARPERTLVSDGATLTIGDWLYKVAEVAGNCDQDAADRLRFTAEDL